MQIIYAAMCNLLVQLASERELLIQKYESLIRQCKKRLEKLKAGASPEDVIF